MVYTVGGVTSTEAVKLTITETLESSQTVTAAESGQVNVSPSSNITSFANRDRSAGTYSLSSSSGDHVFLVLTAAVIFHLQVRSITIHRKHTILILIIWR